ncbi:MAG TPA: porin family protein [Gemmatimonadales bacterium]|nr:porin family protein [Gemmatimonadales bacterium]
MNRTTVALMFASCTLLAAPAAAQSGFSVLGGFVSASVSYEFEDGDMADDIASRTGFAIGVGLNRAGAGAISFAPELLYVVKGANDDDSDFFTKQSYLEVPLLFRYSFRGSGSATPYVTAGPTIGFLASCSAGDEDGSEKCDDFFGEDNSYKSLDYGLMAGVGINFGKFGVSARYEMGLANITEESCCTEKNKALMVLGSVAF